MFKNFITFAILAFIFLFFYQTSNYYFSESNVNKNNMNTLKTKKDLLKKTSNLKVLKNDTNNVIEFNNGFNINDKTKPKRRFWDLITK